MSYDLYLASPGLSRESFNAYFARRPNYETAGFYNNEVTGVHFIFNFVEPGADTIDKDDAGPVSRVQMAPHVAFSLNFMRPHVFAYEAEAELSRFVAYFGCVVHDPQADDEQDECYDRAAFIRRWNAGNDAFCAMQASMNATTLLFAESQVIERVWHWNNEYAATSLFENNHYAPRIMWAAGRPDEPLFRIAVWGAGTPSAFPDCTTHVLLVRRRIGFADQAAADAGGMEHKLVRVDTVAELNSNRWVKTKRCRVLLTSRESPAPREVAALFGGRFTGVEGVRFVSPAEVLTAPPPGR